MKKEKPRFFCDNCSSEVPQDAQECPQCGRSFASVRCPNCGFIGEVEVFNGGCPSCGVSITKEETSKPPAPQVKSPPKQEPEEWSSIRTLPLWVYIVTGVFFIGVLVALYFSLSKV